MDPTMTMFDDSIPPTQNLENSELFKKRKQLTGHSSDVDALTHVLKRPRYSLPLAYTLAVASKLVYEDTAVIKYELEKAGFDVERTFRPIAYHNVCAFIVEKDDDILLVFRGTNPLNIGNYLTNINIAMGEVRAPWGSMGEVHKGFWEAMGDPRPACATPAQAATVRIELSNTSLYRTIMSTLQAAIKIVQFLTKNLFQHVAEPVDNSYLGHDSDIRSYSMYAQGEQYIMSLINHSHSEKLVPDAKIKLRNGIQRPKRLFITGHSLGGALGTNSRYNITLYPPNPYTNEPVPLRPISYLHLSGLLNIHVIRRLISETWMRILFRAVFPFFFNDHFPSDYCHSLRNGTVNWVIVGTSGLHGGDEDEQRRLLTTSHRRCSMVDIKNDASRV
ncbi:hypothetical protein DFQ28_005035 [Apophysomyces sp. BC1034]|nr:hypothetical protein DFQ30_000607 [Apophysomyces sp. BC1015]KAG0194822.1 hypothetical protein DFQ28_005035 [Apophysomyces sp. BC1034]